MPRHSAEELNAIWESIEEAKARLEEKAQSGDKKTTLNLHQLAREIGIHRDTLARILNSDVIRKRRLGLDGFR